MASHDLEDLIAVVDGRAEIVDEMANARTEVKAYIASKFDLLMRNSAFREALQGHLLPDAASQARLPLVIERMRAISALAE